jgi:malonate-semialdehyde dehydrogenase (acetylating) / methylmalonate-semialdehyde dehydrogenase
VFSFTGNKASIRGDLNFYGPSGVQFFTQLKTVTSNWPFQLSGADLGGVTMPTMGLKK